MLRRLKKIKTVPWEEEQLSEQGEQQIIDRDFSSWTKVWWCIIGENASSEYDRSSPSIVS